MLGSHTALTPNLRELVRAHCGGRFIPAKRGNVLVRAARDGPFGKGSEVFGTCRDQYGHRNPPKRAALRD